MLDVSSAYQAKLDHKTSLKPVFLLSIDGYSKTFSSRKGYGTSTWISEISGGSQSVDPVEGTSTLDNLVVTVVDKGRQVTADFPLTLFDGRPAVLKSGFDGMDEADFLTVFTGFIETVPTSNDGTTYDFNIKSPDRITEQVIFTEGDDGQPTSSDHPHSILANPLDLLYHILSEWIGFADHKINLAVMNAFRDQLWGGMMFEFDITSPPDAKTFIEQEIMKPLGGWAFTDENGKYQVGFTQPLAGTTSPVFTFDEHNLSRVPSWEQSDLINVVSYRFDENEGKFMYETVEVEGDSSERFGQQGQVVIESKGVRSGFQGSALAMMVARSLFARFADKNPRMMLPCDWTGVAVQLGDFVTVSHPQVPNRWTGTPGVQLLMQVVEKRPNWMEGTIEFGVIDASKMQTYGIARIAPDGTPAYPSASEYQKGRYLFVTDPDGDRGDGTEGAKFA